jgi:hypothetical protein
VRAGMVRALVWSVNERNHGRLNLLEFQRAGKSGREWFAVIRGAERRGIPGR